jgi:hypothetical protein
MENEKQGPAMSADQAPTFQPQCLGSILDLGLSIDIAMNGNQIFMGLFLWRISKSSKIQPIFVLKPMVLGMLPLYSRKPPCPSSILKGLKSLPLMILPALQEYGLKVGLDFPASFENLGGKLMIHCLCSMYYNTILKSSTIWLFNIAMENHHF